MEKFTAKQEFIMKGIFFIIFSLVYLLTTTPILKLAQEWIQIHHHILVLSSFFGMSIFGVESLVIGLNLLSKYFKSKEDK